MKNSQNKKNRVKKSVFISGVSRGIGANIARFFLRKKRWNVIGISRSRPSINNERFVWMKCDITRLEEVERFLEQNKVRLDCVVHNAAIAGPVGPSLNIALEKWRDVFEVNFFSHLGITARLIPHCRPGACFIFISGGGAVTPRALVGPYAISKLAVTKLAEQLSIEYKRFRFYAMAPGAHDTQMFRYHFGKTGEAVPQFADFKAVELLLEVLAHDTKRRLNGRLVHVRDNIDLLLSLRDGGYIRRIEKRQ